MSEWIIIVFIGEFILLAIVSILDCNYALALYGVGGEVLNVGVLWMK